MRILHSNKAVYLLNARACAVRMRTTLYMATAAAPSLCGGEIVVVELKVFHYHRLTLDNGHYV